MSGGGDKPALPGPVWVKRSSGAFELWQVLANPQNQSRAVLSPATDELRIFVGDGTGLWKSVPAGELGECNPSLQITIRLDPLMDEPAAMAWAMAARPLKRVEVERAESHPARTTQFEPMRKVMTLGGCDVCSGPQSVEYVSQSFQLTSVALCHACDDPALARRAARNGNGGWRYVWNIEIGRVPP